MKKKLVAFALLCLTQASMLSVPTARSQSNDCARVFRRDADVCDQKSKAIFDSGSDNAPSESSKTFNSCLQEASRQQVCCNMEFNVTQSNYGKVNGDQYVVRKDGQCIRTQSLAKKNSCYGDCDKKIAASGGSSMSLFCVIGCKKLFGD